MRVRLGSCKIDLMPQYFYITDRSNVILLLWFHLFYVLESNFYAVGTFLYVFIFLSFKVSSGNWMAASGEIVSK